MKLSIEKFKTSEQIYQLVKMLLESNIELTMNWRDWDWDWDGDVDLFRHQGLANLLLEYPFAHCGKHRISGIASRCVGLMDDEKLASKLLEHYSLNGNAIDYEEDILIQCLFNNKSESAKTILLEYLKYQSFSWIINSNFYISNAHFIENGVIKPCWQPDIVELLESLNAPVTLYIPSEISEDSYIMDYTSVLGKILKPTPLYHKSQTNGVYYWYNSSDVLQPILQLPSKDLMYQWWETVKNIII